MKDKLILLISAVMFLFLTGISAYEGIEYGALKGTVLDSDKNPVSGALIIIGYYNRKEIVRTENGYQTVNVGIRKSITDKDGNYRIDEIATGFIPIKVEIDDRLIYSELISVVSGEQTYNILINPVYKHETGESLLNETIYRSVVSGKIRDASNDKPLKGVKVIIENTSAETDKEGNFLIYDAKSEYNRIVLEKFGYKKYTNSILLNVGTNQYSFKMEPEEVNSVITGKVVDYDTGMPLENVLVKVSNRSSWTNGDGEYQILTSFGKNHVITVEYPDYKSVNQYIHVEKQKEIYNILLRKVISVPYEKPVINYRSLFSEPQEKSIPHYHNNESREIPGRTYKEQENLNKNHVPYNENKTSVTVNKEFADKTSNKISVSGGTGYFFNQTADIISEGKLNAGNKYIVMNTDGSKKNEFVVTNVVYGLTEKTEIGVSHISYQSQMEDSDSVSSNSSTFVNGKYQLYKGRDETTAGVGFELADNEMSLYGAYDLPLRVAGSNRGDLSFQFKRVSSGNSHATKIGVGSTFNFAKQYALVMESEKNIEDDYYSYNMGLRVSPEKFPGFEVFYSKSFRMEDIEGMGAGVNWEF